MSYFKFYIKIFRKSAKNTKKCFKQKNVLNKSYMI